MYTHILFQILSIIGYCKIQNIVHCAVEQVLTVYLFNTGQCKYVPPKFQIYSLLPQGLCPNCSFLWSVPLPYQHMLGSFLISIFPLSLSTWKCFHDHPSVSHSFTDVPDLFSPGTQHSLISGTKMAVPIITVMDTDY